MVSQLHNADMSRRAAVIIGALVAAVGVLLVAEAAGQTAGQTVRVTITDSKLTLHPASVQQGKVTFRIEEVGVHAHAFAIAGRSTRVLRHGATAVLVVGFSKAANYRAVARGSLGRAFSANLVVGSASQTILPTTTTSPVKTSTSTTPGVGSACAQPVATTVTVTIVPPKFNFSRITIPCGTVTFVVTNTGQLTHSLEITAPAGAATIPTNPAIQPGQTQTFTVTMTAKGIYPWQCGEREDNSDEGEYGNLLVQ
jgi:plastocyanin